MHDGSAYNIWRRHFRVHDAGDWFCIVWRPGWIFRSWLSSWSSTLELWIYGMPSFFCPSHVMFWSKRASKIFLSDTMEAFYIITFAFSAWSVFVFVSQCRWLLLISWSAIVLIRSMFVPLDKLLWAGPSSSWSRGTANHEWTVWLVLLALFVRISLAYDW